LYFDSYRGFSFIFLVGSVFFLLPSFVGAVDGLVDVAGLFARFDSVISPSELLNLDGDTSLIAFFAGGVLDAFGLTVAVGDCVLKDGSIDSFVLTGFCHANVDGDLGAVTVPLTPSLFLAVPFPRFKNIFSGSTTFRVL
jgi:hypothetical protein